MLFYLLFLNIALIKNSSGWFSVKLGLFFNKFTTFWLLLCILRFHIETLTKLLLFWGPWFSPFAYLNMLKHDISGRILLSVMSRLRRSPSCRYLVVSLDYDPTFSWRDICWYLNASLAKFTRRWILILRLNGHRRHWWLLNNLILLFFLLVQLNVSTIMHSIYSHPWFLLQCNHIIF